MEIHTALDRVHISEACFDALKQRGKVRWKGIFETYEFTIGGCRNSPRKDNVDHVRTFYFYKTDQCTYECRLYFLEMPVNDMLNALEYLKSELESVTKPSSQFPAKLKI